VLPRGSGQQIRGLNWSSKRPQLIIIDDLEDKDECKNEEIRKRQKQWLLSDVLKSVNKYLKDWTVVYIDTLKHEDSVLQMLLDSSDWESISLSICDSNYKSHDVNYMTDEEIMAEVEAHREKGELDVFYMEYMGVPISTEDAVFKPDYFRYYEEASIVNNKDIENIIVVDPAKTVKMHSAESAILGIGLDRGSHRIYVRDIVHRKMYPDEIYQETFDMAERLKVSVIGVEVTSLEEFIKQPLTNEMMRRGRFYEFVWLKARGGQNLQKGKEGRVAALAPFYRQGFIFHNKTSCADLEAQLLAFPKSRLWDIMDGLAYVVEMMEMGGRYFQPPEEFDDPEEEYKELENEYEPAVDGWRMI
jgi:predicted phage terminase large subunit-like protein